VGLRTARTTPAGRTSYPGATNEERTIVYALRRSTGLPLEDLAFVVTQFLPHPNRNAV
jgi:hypothetical protein